MASFIPQRVYSNVWTSVKTDDLRVEKKQATEEGIDLSSVQDEFARLEQQENLNTIGLQERAELLLDSIQTLPLVAGYPHNEPSDFDAIRAARPAPVVLPTEVLADAVLLNKALGGWQGRASGCLLGKPVEGRKSAQIRTYLEAQGRWPLDRYFSNQAPEELAKECGIHQGWKGVYEEDITCMVEDDDTNYTVTGLAIIEGKGAAFTPQDVADFWLVNIPFMHVCTAERIAYRNFTLNIPPPDSARYRNVYRELIGAQIRADFFGYVNPANPELAADFAWRDASISHVKNGIYGEMWVAAMLAAAYVCDDVETVIRAGLAQIPATSRLTANVEHIIKLYRDGISYEDAIADMRMRWDEYHFYDWCHTISNAEIVTIALLWGEKDFEKTITYSVMPGLDTDCNGATAGSVLGVILGAEALPAKWIAPMNDTLLTGVAGYYKVSLTEMAGKTLELIKRIQGEKPC